MIRAVIDTNLLVSGLLNDSGAPAKLILRWLKGQFDFLISDEIMNEYAYVLHHLPEIDPQKVSDLLAELRVSGIRVAIPGTLQACKDVDDDKFLETAVTGQAEYLVTKNTKHFPHKTYQGVRIVKVSKFLEELEKQFSS
ncbi:putative toxin-antitoxin system toxin component, PIN family [candidate division KSB1 bacterium]|nr:putative toxin-antitoxin system toxin component, PIN family [bacterium]NUM66950.1 putative toxin-antitoxin system toxin component, PIN family [candidate division KSB1 bacterium]